MRLGLLVVVLFCALMGSPRAIAHDLSALAGEAVALARTVAEPGERELALRTVSRTLRAGYRQRALEAARAMRDPREASTFGPAADSISAGIQAGVAATEAERRRCERLLEQRPSAAALEAQVVQCFLIGDPHFQARPSPRLLLTYAAALPPGEAQAQLLQMSFAVAAGVDRAAAREALDAARLLRNRVSGNARTHLAAFLDSPEVHLFEGAPERAIAAAGRSEDPFALPSLLGALVDLGHVDEALRVVGLLDSSDGCPLDGAILYLGEPSSDAGRRNLGAFLDRLGTDAGYRRVCPAGLPPQTRAGLEVAANRLDRALALLPDRRRIDAHAILLDGTARQLQLGQRDHARSLLIELAGAMPNVEQVPEGDRRVAARNRFELVHQLSRIGEIEIALQLARGYLGPGWRAAALATIADLARPRPADAPLFLHDPDIAPLS